MSMFRVLKLNKEFRTAYYRGRAWSHPLFVVYLRKNRFGEMRLGITTGKKLGHAVARNRCRRLVREAYRHILPELTDGYDMVVVARTAMIASDSIKVEQALRTVLKKAGLLS